MSELRRITERYRLDKLVAAGEMSSVFRGIDTQSGETVAVKLLNSDAVESDEQRERFLELCRTLQSIRHASLPKVLDFGFTTAGSAFLVTEYLSGERLEELAGLSPTRALALLLGVVDGLEALAQAGLASRNLKAANLLISPIAGGEQVKILGLGSPALRPEADPPAAEAWQQDLFDFGNLVYRLLGLATGTYSEVVIPQEVAAKLADFDVLGGLVQACLQKDPKGRFPSCAEVRSALRQALFGHCEVSVTPQATVFVPSTRTAGAAATLAIRPERASPAAAGTIIVPRSGLQELGEPPPPQPRQDLRDVGNATRIVSPTNDDSATLYVPAGESPFARESAATVRLPGSVAPTGQAVAATVRIPDLQPPPAHPSPPRPPLPFSPSPAAARPPAQPVRPASPPLPSAVAAATKPPGKGRLLIVAGAAAGVVLLAGLLFLWIKSRSVPSAPPVSNAVSTPAPAPSPPVPTQTAPLPVNPMIAKADTALAKSDLKAVKAALDAIPAKDRAAFRPEERDRYQHLLDSLAPLKKTEQAAHLTQALASGDLRALRRAVDAIPKADEAGLPAGTRKDLEHARLALEADARLSQAEKTGDRLDVIREAGALLRELPHAARAGELREQAAGAVEGEVDTALAAGQLDAAASRLESLRQAWPERAGLVARAERIAAEKKSDQEMETRLAAAGQSEKANKPLEGLQLLANLKPSPRYADRVQALRQRLNAQFAQLDRQPPVVALHSPEAEYEKGKTATIQLQVTDDMGVKTVEGWARAEGGTFVKLAVRHVSGADYVMEVAPDLHDNKTIEFYATATDQSGHIGRVGSADRPLKMKRKTLFDKLRDKLNG